MVYYSGSKAARNANSISNRPNGGGMKKAGIASRQGWFMQSNPTLRRAPQTLPLKTVNYHIIQTQRYGYQATLGPM